jgi:L-threonylcarbamoyladenylate synthase
MAFTIFRVQLDVHERLEYFFRNELQECITTLINGGTIVFPTETLYGLGVDISNENAIDRLIALKNRPHNIPIAVAVTDIKQVEQLAIVSKLAKRIITDCLPKPITILLKTKNTVNRKLLGGSDLIGFRFPDHPVTIEIINRFGPITATSANLHGAPPPEVIGTAIEQFGDLINIYIDSGKCRYSKPSTVVDTTGDTIKIIRHGACSGTELEECMGGA